MNKLLLSLPLLLISAFTLTAQPDWVGNLFPSGTGNDAVTGSGYVITIDVWEPGVTDSPGQGAGIDCYLHYGTVNMFGDPWSNITTVQMSYHGDTGNNDVYEYDLDLPAGMYEYTCYCEDAGGVFWSVDANGGVTFNAPLPVETTYFRAEANEAGNVVLDWATASETNNSHFEIEKSSDSRNWSVLGTVQGNGNSITEQVYRFIDNSPFQGGNYYRLKQVDFDQSFDYSKIVSVLFETNQTHLYPNPATDHATLTFDDSYNGSLAIYNLQGQLVQSLNIVNKEQVAINLQDLQKGIYFIELNDENNRLVKVQRLVKY